MCKDCYCSKTACLFKVSLMGVFAALLLALLGLIYPFSVLTVRVPAPLFMAMAFLIPSITLYFNVKDPFWAEVMERHRKSHSKK